MYDTYLDKYVCIYVCIIIAPGSYNMPVSVELTDLTSLHFVCKMLEVWSALQPAHHRATLAWAVWCGVLSGTLEGTYQNSSWH